MITYLESSQLPHNDQQARSLLLTIDDYFLDEDGLLYHLWTPIRSKHKTIYQQLVIPTALRYEILTWGHDDPTSAHFGTTKTYEKLRKQRHRLKYGNAESSLAVGDVVVIKSVERNHNCWPLGIIEDLIIGQDQVVCSAKLRVGKPVLERPM